MMDLLCKLLVIYYVLYMFLEVTGSVCPLQNKTETPKFTIPLNAADWVRYDHAQSLLCCAEGYDRIEWFKKNDSTWQQFPPSSSESQQAPYLREHGQVLQILSARLSDKGLYQCNVIKHGLVVLNHTVKLTVIECDISSQGPKVTEPFPLNQTIDRYGGNVTLYCTGYFGCRDGEISMSIAKWSVLGTRRAISNISSRYHVTYGSREGGDVKQANLTISPVREEDTKRTFLCIVASDQKIRGQTIIPVKIRKQDDKPFITWLQIGLIIGSCVFMTIIVIIALCLRCLCGPQVRLVINRIVPKFGPKYIDDKNIIWNLYIYHADEDECIATQWKNVLENLGYKVRITADLKGGQSEMNDFKEATTKSALVVFLYSENLLVEERANLFLDTVVIERNGKDIMFLEKTHFKPKEIRDWARAAKHLNGEAVGDNDVAISIEEDAFEGRVDDTEDAIAQKIDNLKFWRIIPRFKVPKEGASKRVMNNFVCSLRNNIPRFREPGEETVGKKVIKDRSGSGKPLLEEEPPNSPISPAGFVNQTLEMSPDMSPDQACKFDFDETSVKKVVEAGDRNKTNGTSAHIEFEDSENGLYENPHGELYIVPGHKDIVIDAVVHDMEANNISNYNDNRDGEIYAANRENAVSEPISTEQTMFSMSGEEESKSCSPNAESAYTSSCEESARGENITSENDDMSSQNASSSQSSSGFESQSSQASSPFNMADQSFSPDDQYARHTNGFPGQTFTNAVDPSKTPNIQIEVKDNANGKVATGKDGKGLKVTIDKNKRTGSGSSPESGYMTSSSERYSSAGAFLPQIKEAVG